MRRTIRASWLATAAGIAVIATACTAPSEERGLDEFVLAFQVTDDRRAFVEETRPLADWISSQTGTPTRVLTVQDDRAQITALATGQAHAAYMSGGPSWVGWQSFGLEAIVAEVRNEDNRTAYIAGLWVLRDGGIETVEGLRGRPSCHTGELTGTGMFVPIGHLVRHGYVDTDGLDMDDVSSLSTLRARFFGDPKIGGGYHGAFQCLSTGEGDVATGRDTAWKDFCGGAHPEPWCLPEEAYRFLPGPGTGEGLEEGGLARVPSHPVMVSPHLGEEDRESLREAFLALSQSQEGRTILEDILGVADLVEVSSEEHLGPYGEVLEHVPGIRAHFLQGDG